jgi:hypothetical protein
MILQQDDPDLGPLLHINSHLKYSAVITLD